MAAKVLHQTLLNAYIGMPRATPDDFTLEYSIDEGATWNPLATVHLVIYDLYEWNVPDFVTGKAMVRISRDGISDINETPFSIMRPPVNVSIAKTCPHYVRIDWGVELGTGADSFHIYVLGDKYMDSVGIIDQLYYDIPDSIISLGDWVSVRCANTEGAKSLRAIAIPYDSVVVANCDQNYDSYMRKIIEPSNEEVFSCEDYTSNVRVQLTNLGNENAYDIPIHYSFNNTTVSDTITDTILSGASWIHTFSVPIQVSTAGTYTLTTWTSWDIDEYFGNDTLSQTMTLKLFGDPNSAVSLDYQEDFQASVNTMFPPLWTLQNPDGDLTWEPVNVMGPYGQFTKAAYVNFFDYQEEGELDHLISPLINLTGTSKAWLRFDYAYAYFGGFGNDFTDTLQIDLSTDCDAGFEHTIFYSGGDDLATVPVLSQPFAPTSASDWQTDSIDISAYIGESVILRFTSINGYGNAIYLDNINVYQADSVVAVFDPVSSKEIQVWPNPSDGQFTIRTSKNMDISDAHVYDTHGRIAWTATPDVISQTEEYFPLILNDLAQGVYMLRVQTVDGKEYQKRLVVLRK